MNSNTHSHLASRWKVHSTIAICAIVVLVLATSVATAAGAERLLPKPGGDAQVQQALAAARAHTRPKTQAGAAAARPKPQPLPTRKAGVLDMRQGPFSATDFAVQNFWRGQLGASWLLVYAGTRRSPEGAPDQAAIRVYSESPDLRLTLIGTFPLNDGSKAARVSGSNGSMVELQTDGGRKISFDLNARQFK